MSTCKNRRNRCRETAGTASKAAGRAIPPVGRPTSATGVRRAAAMLLDGEAEALTRKAAELALGAAVAVRA